MKRRKTRKIFVGDVPIGGGAPISVQSMTKTNTNDVGGTIAQIRRLAEAGCEIIRCAVPEEGAARSLKIICSESPIPVVADVHFSYKLALKAIESGVDCLRMNPGNIDKPEHVREIAAALKDADIPIRVGVNAGSLSKRWRKKVRAGECRLAEAMVESALTHIRMLEDLDVTEMKIALKASDAAVTVEAYRLMAKKCDYPFHVGITEAGTLRTGIIKSSIGIGILLMDGLVDTLRVSLTADPEEEVYTGLKILQALGLKESGPELISCPTCGRVQIDLMDIAEKVEKKISTMNIPIKVAVMGCVVNGPGEAEEADVGIAGGKGSGVVFRKGKIIRQVAEKDLVKALMEEIDKIKMEKDFGY